MHFVTFMQVFLILENVYNPILSLTIRTKHLTPTLKLCLNF